MSEHEGAWLVVSQADTAAEQANHHLGETLVMWANDPLPDIDHLILSLTQALDRARELRAKVSKAEAESKDWAEVERVTGAVRQKSPGDTLVRFRDGGVSLAELRQLVEAGLADPEDRQNDSPSLGEFLRDLDHLGDLVRFIGYVVYPPRSDDRVTVEGFRVEPLPADEALELMEKYGRADDKSKKKVKGGYRVSFWWD